ncbi:hypothetical protein FRC00_008446 [Tulasnella sp. 408]|nr:hypothetical protein FRC00_008446 [Tulasnella sp. 408]
MWQDSPIGSHQLPEEILIEIIRRAASNRRLDPESLVPSDPTLFESLNRYREVCKRWKTVIDGTPSLWTFLSAHDFSSVEALQKVIEKSGNAPLVISCGHPWMGLQYFVETVAPQMRRCKVLWITASCLDHPSMFEPLLSHPRPILEELHFDPGCWWTVCVDGVDSNTGDRSGTTYFDIWALRHNAKGLKALSLVYVEGWRIGSQLTNLRELRLDCSRMWSKSLMQGLAELSFLRTLIIDISFGEMHIFPDNATVVELPLLTRIELRREVTPFVHALLSRINPPSLKQLVLSISNFDSPLFPLGDVGPAYHALFLSLMKAQGAIPIPIEVRVGSLELSIADKQTGRRFELSAYGIQIGDYLGHFVQSLSNITRQWGTMSTPLFALLFGTTERGPRYKEIHLPQKCLRPLMDIEGVTEIRLGDTADHVEYLYQLISFPVDEEDQPRRWLLPRLTILEIKGHQSQDTALAHMLEARYATTVTANEDTLAPLPLALLILVRDSGKVPEPQIADKIRGIIGEEHFRLEIY